ncbi:MAG: GntR family transcriptional regulator [Pseudomonadota bacterium]
MKKKAEIKPIKIMKNPDQNRQTKTLIEEAYRRIKQMIYDQKFAPGQRLVNKDLAEVLKMSRTPIINALNRMVQDGVIGFESFRGFYVRPIDLEEIWEAFGVREAFEVYTVEQAIKLSNAKDMALLEGKLREHREYVPHYYTRRKFQLDSEFHLQIADMAKNNVLKWLLKRNFEHIYLRARLENYNPGRMISSAEEHERLVLSMKKKDIIGSVEIIRNHVQKARDHVIRCLSDEEREARVEPVSV